MATTDQQNALKDAMARAKQIAAKLQQQKAGGEPLSVDNDNTRKRSLVDSIVETPAKRNPIVEHADPKSIAQQVANSLVQKSGAGLGYMLVEEVSIPNKLVGLVIGRGGEMINKLQSECGAKVQVAPDPPPEMAALIEDRQITITGTTDSVERAKALIEEIRVGQKIPERLMVGTLPGEFSVEMMISKSKVGLVIGKGGETIKNLQERAGCKMVLFQDGAYATAQEKPLRISGEQSTVMYGKQLVQDLLTSKELEGLNSEKQNYKEIEVPRAAVGLVIGSKGSNIQQIQADTGCKVQFKNDMEGATKTAMLTGNPQQLAAAEAKLMEIINTNSQSQRAGGGKQNWGQSPGGGASFNGDSGQGWVPSGHRDMIVEVPANKCGLVIGKGGEKIRYIHSETKVNIEINRESQDSAHMRVFHLRGTDEQVQNALAIIREITNDPSIDARPSENDTQQNQWGAPSGGNVPAHQQNQPWDQQQQQQQWPGQQPQPPMQPQQQPPWGQPQYEQQGGWNQQPQQQPGAPPVWNQVPQQPPQPVWDPQTQQWQQPNPTQPQAPWAIQQPQQPYAQPGQPYQQPQQPVVSQPGHPAQPPASVPSADPALAAAPQPTSQPDYSAAWAEYYRQQQIQQQQIQQQQQQQQATQYYQQYGMQQPASTAPGGAIPGQPAQYAHTQTADTPTSTNNSQAMADYQAKLAEYYKSIGQHPPQ